MPNIVSWRELSDRSEQAQARLATIAENDCWQGSARAFAIADRAQRLGIPLAYDFAQIVSSAYTDHCGRAIGYLAHECAECGSVVLGDTAARECCHHNLDDDE